MWIYITVKRWSVLQKYRSQFYGSREKLECAMCQNEDEDINHFKLKCRTLVNIRTVFMTKLKNILLKLDMYDFILRNYLLLQLILLFLWSYKAMVLDAKLNPSPEVYASHYIDRDVHSWVRCINLDFTFNQLSIIVVHSFY